MNRQEWTLVAAAVLVLAGAIYFLLRADRSMERSARTANAAVLENPSKDVRVKAAGEVMWFPADTQQGLSLGDSVFTGKQSSVTVRMRDGSLIGLRANSLITIREQVGVRFASLEGGSFSMAVNGSTQVMVNGQLTTIEGHGEIELAVEKSNPVPRLSVVKGSAVLQRPIWGRENQRRELSGTHVLQIPQFIGDAKDLYHDWRIADWFEVSAGALKRRTSDPVDVVAEALPLTWTNGENVDLVLTGDRPERKIVLKNQTNTAWLKELFIGENQARLTRDGGTWSEARIFKVIPRFNLLPPVWTSSSAKVRLIGQSDAKFRLNWREVAGAKGYLVEESADSGFKSSNVRRQFESSYQVARPVAGEWFVRLWSFDEADRLSPPGEILRLETLPRLTPKPAVEMTPLAKHPPPAPVETPLPEPAVQAKPVSTLSVPLAKIGEQLNQWYNAGKLQFESSMFSMYSTAQTRAGEASPVAGMFGLRWTKWFGKVGAEVAARVRAMAFNETANEVNAMSAEVRIYRRKTMVWPQFWIFKNYQAAVLIGLEVYRNDNDGLFSEGYQMLKSGFALNFPLGQTWETGGEALMGLTADFSRKYELSGFLNYFVAKRWALGVGYRAHMFEAQTKNSAPVALPYREAYGEGFGLIKYHF